MTELYGNSQKDPVYGYLENPRELLFIDTVHTEEQTFNELELHSHKVSKYIAFHDVTAPRFGTLAGINRWWKDHPEWKLKYQDFEDCGFMVLERIEE